LKALDNIDCKMIVFSSSATVYGNPKYLPFDEYHPTDPINVYGKTKLISENMIKSWCKNRPCRLSIALRYFNPVGAHTSCLFGENPSGIPNNLLPYICKVANNEIEYLKIFGNDYDTIDGTGVRDYLHVMDIADAHTKCLELLNKRSGFLKLNLGFGHGYSVFEVINTFEKINNVKIPYLFSKRRKEI
jgi:UDP-glucose 4-epimerase